MRKTILAALACAALLGLAGPAAAQLDLSKTAAAADPLTKLPADQWAILATNLVNGRSVIGLPMVFMVNATGQEITAVVCDGKWQLVGPKPYNADGPSTLPAWKVTLVDTKGFDGYCRSGLTAQSDNGVVYRGALVSADGTFSSATFITFLRAAQ
jgi:hypothetical protein